MHTISENRLLHLAHEGKIESARVSGDQDGFYLVVQTAAGEPLVLSGQNAVRPFPTLKDAADYLRPLGIPYTVAGRERQRATDGGADLTYDAYVMASLNAARRDTRPAAANRDVMEAARHIVNSRKRGPHA